MSNYCIKVEGGNYDYLEFEDRFAVLKIAGLFSHLRRSKDEIRRQLKILEDMEEGAFVIIGGVVFVKIKKTEEIQADIDKAKEEEMKIQKEHKKYHQTKHTNTKKFKYD